MHACLQRECASIHIITHCINPDKIRHYTTDAKAHAFRPRQFKFRTRILNTAWGRLIFKIIRADPAILPPLADHQKIVAYLFLESVESLFPGIPFDAPAPRKRIIDKGQFLRQRRCSPPITRITGPGDLIFRRKTKCLLCPGRRPRFQQRRIGARLTNKGTLHGGTHKLLSRRKPEIAKTIIECRYQAHRPNRIHGNPSLNP